jgi:hypothetical protein
VDDDLSLPDALAEAFRRLDVEEGRRAAALIPDRVLRILCDELADMLDADGRWDQPHVLIGVTTLDTAARHSGLEPDQAAAWFSEDDPQLRTELESLFSDGVTVSDDDVSVGLGIAVLGTSTAATIETLEGYRAPDEIAALVLLQEGWLTSEHIQGERGPDGRIETRIVTAVSRTGAQVHLMGPRGGERLVSEAAAEQGALALDHPKRRAEELPMAGRIIGSLQRALDVPTTPRSHRPWLLLADWWGDVIARNWPRVVEEGPEEAAWTALAHRPDMMAATARYAQGQIARHLENAGVDPDPDQQLDDPAVDAALAGFKPVHLLEEVRSRCAQAGSYEPLEEVEDTVRELLTELPQQSLTTAASIIWGLEHERDRDGSGWWDANLLLWDTAAVDPDTSGGRRRVNGLPKVPGWFKDSNRRYIKWAEKAEVAPFPNPNLAADD